MAFFLLISVVQATTETRYLQKENWDAQYPNQLRIDWDDTTYDSGSITYAGYVRNASWGIRVWLNNTATKLEYRELTSGSPVAVVTRTAGGGFGAQAATWPCPESPLLNATDALVVKWYAILYRINNAGSTGWTEISSARSRTEALNANYVNSSTWTVTQYTKLANASLSSSAQLAWDGNSESADYYPTRIANFVWNPTPPVGGTTYRVDLTLSVTRTFTQAIRSIFHVNPALTATYTLSSSEQASYTVPLSLPTTYTLEPNLNAHYSVSIGLPTTFTFDLGTQTTYGVPLNLPTTHTLTFGAQTIYNVLLDLTTTYTFTIPPWSTGIIPAEPPGGSQKGTPLPPRIVVQPYQVGIGVLIFCAAVLVVSQVAKPKRNRVSAPHTKQIRTPSHHIRSSEPVKFERKTTVIHAPEKKRVVYPSKEVNYPKGHVAEPRKPRIKKPRKPLK